MAYIGWVKIHRKLIEKGYYKKSQYVHLWVHLLLSANHKPNEFMWNKKMIIIKEGQLLTGRKELTEQTGIPETTIERILEMLESEHQIGQQKTTKFRIITILNWREYQNADNKIDNKRTTSGQQADTNKNEDTVNNEKKIINEVFDSWNIFANENNLPTIMKLTDKRISAIKNRLKEEEFNFEQILELIRNSDFLLGKIKDFKVDFDFIFLSKHNYIKILEGKYNHESNQGRTIEFNHA